MRRPGDRKTDFDSASAGHLVAVARRKDGMLIDVALSVSPIKDSAGRIVGAAKIARDITELRSGERSICRFRLVWFVQIETEGDRSRDRR